VKIDSNHVGLSFLQSRIAYRKKDYTLAARTLLRMDSKTDLPLIYNNLLGYSLIQTDSTDKAIFYLRRTLEKEAKNEYALFYMGLAYEKKKLYEEALHFFKEAIVAGISENMHLFYQGEARSYHHLGKYQSVLTSYGKSLAYKPEADIWYYMANTAETGLKQPGKAIRYYEKFLAAKPTDPEKISDAKQRLTVLKEHVFMKKGNKK
jgi:tetratricopeptide (TPR) repeat protein